MSVAKTGALEDQTDRGMPSIVRSKITTPSSLKLISFVAALACTLVFGIAVVFPKPQSRNPEHCCYLTLLWPPPTNTLLPFSVGLARPGELSFGLWLPMVGVKAQRWQEQLMPQGRVVTP